MKKEMNEKQKKMILKKAIQTAEKNLISGNWTVETAQLYIKGADEWPEMYVVS